MKKFAGLFVGSGASRKIGLGFVPDKVTIQNITAADVGRIEWSRLMASLAAVGGGLLTEESTGLATAKIAQASGVSVYLGGELITSASAAALIASHAIPAYAGDMRDKHTAGLVDGWTLDTAANRTGHFNVEASTTYVGPGSRILIGDEWYTIQAMTSNGEAANEITLDRAALSGEIKKITFPYDLYNAPAGTVMPAGIILAETAVVNETAELCYIEAESYGEI